MEAEKTKAVTAGKDAKALCDKMNRELRSVQLVEAKLKAKCDRWGQGVVEYLRKETADQQTACDVLFTQFVNMQNQLSIMTVESARKWTEDLDIWFDLVDFCLLQLC